MTMATVLDIRDGARGYVAPVRAAAVEREADEALRPAELAGLIWFWNHHEAELGVCSTFGAELERAMLYAPTWGDKQSQQLHGNTQNVREWQSRTWAQRRSATRAWVAAGHDLDAPGSPMWDAEEMRIRPSSPSGDADPYDGIVGLSGDSLDSVKRAGLVRGRLRRCSDGTRRVLFAVFGPSSGDEQQRRDMAKKFGNLVPIVVALVSQQRKDADPPARAIIAAKLTDDSFCRMMKHRASGILHAAAVDYAGTR